MNRSIPQRSLVALALVLTFALGSVPVYAAGAAVPSDVTIGGVSLTGLDAAAARTAIVEASTVPTFMPISVQGAGRTFTRSDAWVRSAVSVTNIDAMLQQALDATGTTTLAPDYAIKSSLVSAWTASIAKSVNHKATNARYKVKKHGLIVTKSATGYTVYTKTMNARITAAIRSQITSVGTEPATVVVPMSLKVVKPKVTRKNIGKAIIVTLSHYTIRLYNDGKLEKKYKCAIGQPGFPTPKGKWKVTGKVKNPSWHNPGSGWAKNMPSVIGPGPSNPLGTRAIYLSAPGIRFHGTYKWWSIGHAASHGCMRMKRKDVEDFYPRVPVGIPVWIVK
jgi:lipoprotein-anchoring transpeptidase ErfK/SrfK